MPIAQWGALLGVAVLVGAVLILKTQRSGAGPASLPTVAAPAPTTVVLSQAPSTPPSQPTPTLLPEAHLDQLLAAGEPAFVFFHSNNCAQCIRMIEIVEQVYPDFAESVPLIDVNVYDERNQNLLQRVGLRYIPTLIFIDRAGQGETHVGVMEAETLREQLQALARE